MIITKADGSTEEFRPQKLASSLKKAGANPNEIAYILSEIESSLEDGMKTQMIYQKAFQLLRNSGESVAARYSLRRAVFNLGPTGFPFEDFLGKIFEAEGYTTKRRLILKGKCATHEVDLAAYSPADTFIAEAKFHARPGVKSDLQVAMYSYARYLDLASTQVCKGDQCGIVSLRVITNTKFTQAAIKYAECSGIKLLSWDYPKHDSLHNKIERHRTYPITVLTHLTTSQKQFLLQNGVILCSDITKNPTILHQINLQRNKFDAVLREAQALCGSL
ncbi:MAG: ATP cone domain-containing protein [Candidatus Kaiserbacteria bacterium]|nr:ATP cone domain-containing protein [Candidatus Kaiserbacteria bacterium]